MQPHVASFDDLDNRTLLGILQLRCEVFIVEQECVYADVDGRDAEPGTRHLWFDEGGTPVAYLRILQRAGRDRPHRPGLHREGRPRAGAVEPADEGRARPGRARGPGAVLNAQSYLVGFYEGFGFAVAGPEFLDDGIPHTPMRRA